MPAERTLPVSAAHREVTVLVNGTQVSRQTHMLSASITKSVNRLSAARLVFLDGAAASSDFPLSSGDQMAPGAEVVVRAGAEDDSTSLFAGVVVGQSIRVRENGTAQLIVDCRHRATKLTIDKRNNTFADQLDSEIITNLLEAAGIDASVEPTSIRHGQLVQFRATDWEFLLARAIANGLLVLTNDQTVEVKAPRFDGKPACTLLYGATILDLDARIDARPQVSRVRAVGWDPAEQSPFEQEADDPGVRGPGAMTTDDLASVASVPGYELRHGGLGSEEARKWADAWWLYSQLGRVSGRVKCIGIGTVNPGARVTLRGVGKRFSGDVFVTGVRHEIDTMQGWRTHVQFGGVAEWLPEPARKTGGDGLLSNVRGLLVGIVVSNEDKTGEHRVCVCLPIVRNDGEGVWARVASLDAGASRGWFFRPEVGDEVVVGFLEDDPRYPVVLGMLHSSAKEPPWTGTDDNHEKGYQSRAGMRLYLNDEKKLMRIETPAGNRVTLSDDDKSILMEDQHGNRIELGSDGIRVESSKSLALKAGTELSLEATSTVAAKGAELKLEGTSGAELTSTAITKVRGSLLQLN